jgi:hypothetical protein
MKLAELKHLIERIQGNTFVSMDCVTEPKLSGGQSNPHRGRVTKKTTGLRVQLFNNTTKNAYEAMVNRRRVIEGNNEPFKVAPLQWGRHVPNSPFIEHNGGLYIQSSATTAASPLHARRQATLTGSDQGPAQGAGQRSPGARRRTR